MSYDCANTDHSTVWAKGCGCQSARASWCHRWNCQSTPSPAARRTCQLPKIRGRSGQSDSAQSSATYSTSEHAFFISDGLQQTHLNPFQWDSKLPTVQLEQQSPCFMECTSQNYLRLCFISHRYSLHMTFTLWLHNRHYGISRCFFVIVCVMAAFVPLSICTTLLETVIWFI